MPPVETPCLMLHQMKLANCHLVVVADIVADIAVIDRNIAVVDIVVIDRNIAVVDIVVIDHNIELNILTLIFCFEHFLLSSNLLLQLCTMIS
jgi:hypothetical protein